MLILIALGALTIAVGALAVAVLVSYRALAAWRELADLLAITSEHAPIAGVLEPGELEGLSS